MTSRDSALKAKHIPVLLTEVIEALRPQAEGVYIDATFGAGGYTRAILDEGVARVLAFDRDPSAIAAGGALVEAYAPRLALIEAPFSALAHEARSQGIAEADGVVLDIGVSSMQIDDASRGFSFQKDGPLDMRMASSGETAADLVNTLPETELADFIYQFGEEHRSRAIARAIVRQRTQTPFTRTLELADTVARVFHGRKVDGRHPATRTFQALRIAVNDELAELRRALVAAEEMLKPGGRLVVVTFHSLEDRIVKRFLARRAGRTPRGSRHLPEQSIKLDAPSFELVNPRPFTPQKGELDMNPRARSARLRAAIRTAAPAFPPGEDEVADDELD